MGKAYRRLWAEVTSFSNLRCSSPPLLAYRLAARGKRSKPAVAGFEFRLEENLLALQDELRQGSYRPGAYHSFLIHDPKRRLISAAPFRDRGRWVHRSTPRVSERDRSAV